jgi:hypothetical protein
MRKLLLQRPNGRASVRRANDNRRTRSRSSGGNYVFAERRLSIIPHLDDDGVGYAQRRDAAHPD